VLRVLGRRESGRDPRPDTGFGEQRLLRPGGRDHQRALVSQGHENGRGGGVGEDQFASLDQRPHPRLAHDQHIGAVRGLRITGAAEFDHGLER
jgi:hypothetical protein